jgi:predicted dehydrogenase
MAEQKVRIGIISANWGLSAHLPAWRAVPGVEAVAICTAHQETAEAAARKANIPKAYWDYKKLAQDPEIDLMDCGTRPNLRYDMVMTSLKAGKHVYNGIPFTDSLKHAKDMYEAYLQSGKVAAVDAYSQYIPAHMLMKEMIEEGALGQLYSLTCHLLLDLFTHPSAGFGYKWFWDRRYGASALRNLGSHALNMLVHLFGEIEEVVGQDELYLKEWKFDDGSVIRPQIEDTSTVLLRFRNGGMGTVHVAWSACAASGWLIEAYGSKGRLAVTSPGMPMSRTTKLYAAKVGQNQTEEVQIPDRLKRRPGISLDADTAPSQHYPMALLFQDMVRAIHTGGEAAPSFTQGFHVHQAIEAVRKSIENRSWVKVGSLR